MSQTKAHLQIVQPLSSRMTEAHVRRHASRAALEYPDGVVAVVWADGTREEFSRTMSGGVPLAGEAAVLTDSCLPADAVYGDQTPTAPALATEITSARIPGQYGMWEVGYEYAVVNGVHHPVHRPDTRRGGIKTPWRKLDGEAWVPSSVMDHPANAGTRAEVSLRLPSEECGHVWGDPIEMDGGAQ